MGVPAQLLPLVIIIPRQLEFRVQRGAAMCGRLEMLAQAGDRSRNIGMAEYRAAGSRFSRAVRPARMCSQRPDEVIAVNCDPQGPIFVRIVRSAFSQAASASGVYASRGLSGGSGVIMQNEPAQVLCYFGGTACAGHGLDVSARAGDEPKAGQPLRPGRERRSGMPQRQIRLGLP